MQALMQRAEVEALLFFSPDFFFYAANFEVDVLVWERPVVLIVPRDGEPLAVLHELSRNHVAFARDRRTLWVDDIEFYSELPHQHAIPLVTDLPCIVARVLSDRGLADARVGVDTASSLVDQVRPLLPRLDVVPLTSDLRRLRFVKSSEELALAREAASLSDWAQERYRKEILPDRLVDELDWRIGAQMMEEAARRWPGESAKLRLMSLSGPESAAPHGSGATTGARIRSNDVLVNIVIVRLNGTTVENERTWIVGKASPRQREAFAAMVEAQAAALALMVAGNPVRAGHDSATAVFEERGFGEFLCHRTGHGMGIGHGSAITAHDFPHDTAFETRPLLAGELYSVEPGIYLPSIGGFRHDDSVIVADAPEMLTHTPRDLDSLTIPA